VLAAVLLASAMKLLDAPSLVTGLVAVAVAIVLLGVPAVLRRIGGRRPPAQPAGDTITLPASMPASSPPARETRAGANLR
jgi:hypothetical protein